jgi:hypothetical protein
MRILLITIFLVLLHADIGISASELRSPNSNSVKIVNPNKNNDSHGKASSSSAKFQPEQKLFTSGKLNISPDNYQQKREVIDWNLTLGFFLGIVASGIASLLYERWTSPVIEITLDDRPLALRQFPNVPPCAFYHLRILNRPVKWQLSSRKPAWSSKATIEVFKLDGAYAIAEPIQARWPSQPEPLIPAISDNKSINLIDFARLMNARKVDIHSHEEQYISLAVKYDGQSECYIFSNESYFHDAWCNPEWRLGKGKYRVLVTVFYERGRTQRKFVLSNLGTARDSIEIEKECGS